MNVIGLTNSFEGPPVRWRSNSIPTSGRRGTLSLGSENDFCVGGGQGLGEKRSSAKFVSYSHCFQLRKSPLLHRLASTR